MEKLSALMDGELEDRELADEIARISGDPDREADWGIYHMIGDSLRGDAVSQDTVTGPVAARLAAEPTVLAPRAWRMRPETRRVALPIAASSSERVAGITVTVSVRWQSGFESAAGPAMTEDIPGTTVVSYFSASRVCQYI